MDKTELIKTFSSNSHAQRYHTGEVIVSEGEPATQGLCFVLSGSVRIVQHSGGMPIPLGTIRTGQFFGETALLLDRNRSASAIADSQDVIIMFLNPERFVAEAHSNFDLIRALVGEAVERIERVIQVLVRMHRPFQVQIDPTLKPVIQANQASNLAIPKLLNHTRTIYVSHQKAVFSQDQRNDGLIYLVIEGSIGVQRNLEESTLDLHEFQPGDFFGYSRPGSAPFREYTAIAMHDTARVISFDEELLFRLMRLNTELFFRFFRSLLTHLLILDDTLRLAAAKNHHGLASDDTQQMIAAALSEGVIESEQD